MGYYHRGEEFPEKTAYYLADKPNCNELKGSGRNSKEVGNEENECSEI